MKTHRPYELVEYDPRWKDHYLEVKERIIPLLGDNLISVEHVGSTSIEGMLAKPQVDILVVVKDLSLIRSSYEAFKARGLVPQGTDYVGIGDEYFTEEEPDGKRITSIHIFQEGNPKIFDNTIVRDYLKENIEDKELYIETKRKLYSLYKDDYESYKTGKKEVVDAIEARAKKWAETR